MPAWRREARVTGSTIVVTGLCPLILQSGKKGIPPPEQLVYPASTLEPSPSANRTLPCALALFPDNPSARVLPWLALSAHEIPQREVNQALIVAAARSVHFVAEPVQNVLIQPDGDTRLPCGHRHHGSTLTLGEIVFLFPGFSRYCSCSLGVACRAEMIRTLSPRHVYTTVKTRARPSIPIVTHRCSSPASSGTVMARSSSSTNVASAGFSLLRPHAAISSMECAVVAVEANLQAQG